MKKHRLINTIFTLQFIKFVVLRPPIDIFSAYLPQTPRSNITACMRKHSISRAGSDKLSLQKVAATSVTTLCRRRRCRRVSSLAKRTTSKKKTVCKHSERERRMKRKFWSRAAPLSWWTRIDFRITHPCMFLPAKSEPLP